MSASKGLALFDAEMMSASKGLALWHGLESCCCSGVSEPAFSGLSGLCFACFGHESCCCLRLSDAVFQGQSAPGYNSRSVSCDVGRPGGYLFSFLYVGSVGDVSRVLLACVLRALGTNPAAVLGFRNRFPRPNFEMISARFQTSVPGYSRSVSCDVARPGGYLP